MGSRLRPHNLKTKTIRRQGFLFIPGNKSFCGFNQFCEIRITRVRHFRQNLAVKFNSRLVQAVHKLAVGDTIEVTGTITNYQGKVQFGAGCTFVSPK